MQKNPTIGKGIDWLLVWLYVMDGAVRAAEGVLPALELALSLILFVACAVHVRIRLRNAKP